MDAIRKLQFKKETIRSKKPSSMMRIVETDLSTIRSESLPYTGHRRVGNCDGCSARD